MSLRDWYIGMALQGFAAQAGTLRKPESGSLFGNDAADVAQDAIMLADAAIALKDKEQE